MIHEIFNLYVNTDYGASRVAKEINKKYKKKPRANGYLDKFTMPIIKDILDNPVYTGKIAFGRHKTEKIDGKRNEYHIVKQMDDSKIIIAEGQHEAIISDELWETARRKRKANAKTKEKIDKAHEYFLSGILKCPSCGGPMYGIHNGHKKKKDGTYYPMSYSYACRSSSLEMGRVCEKPKNYSENKLMDAVTDIIKTLVNDRNFESMVDLSLGKQTNTDEMEAEKNRLQKELDRLERVVSNIESRLNALDYSEKTAARMEESLNSRLEKVLTDIGDIQELIAAINEQVANIREKENSKKQVYDFLRSFEVMFDIMDNADKKMVIKSMIDSIELYPRSNKSGQWIKTIHFKFPMWYNGSTFSNEINFDAEGNFLPNQKTDETVCLLSRPK